MEERLSEPTEEDLDTIYRKVVNDKSKCHGSNQWTEWQNARYPKNNNGNDYETLHDHQILFRYANS